MGIRCTTVAPETTISGPKKGNKKKTSLFVYLFGKRPESFEQQHQEGN